MHVYVDTAGSSNLQKIGKKALVSHEKIEIGLSLSFVKKNKYRNFFLSEEDFILKSDYMQNSKQAHKKLASSDEKKILFLS